MSLDSADEIRRGLMEVKLKREAVEKRTRESVLGKLAELKKETSEQPRKQIMPKKQRGPELE